MNGRRWLRVPLAMALAVGMLFSGSAAAEALCYARYASDGILCAPSVLFQS